LKNMKKSLLDLKKSEEWNKNSKLKWLRSLLRNKERLYLENLKVKNLQEDKTKSTLRT
jgi:hypothetical protein